MSIFNSNGDVRISKSETNDLKVKTKLVQTKSIKDIDKKLNNLAIKPKIEKGVIFMNLYIQIIKIKIIGSGLNRA